MLNDDYAQIFRSFASRRLTSTALAFFVCGSLVIYAVPPERYGTAAVGGSIGFSLMFAYLFFRAGVRQLPVKHRGVLIIVVLLVLSLLLIVQACSVLVLATSTVISPLSFPWGLR